MALKARDQLKTVFGTAELALKADPGESFLIKGIKVFSPSALYATLKIEKTTAGYFRVDKNYNNHLSPPKTYGTDGTLTPYLSKNLLDLLFELGIFKGYPVAEGQTFLLTGLGTDANVITFIYDIYDAEDQKKEAPNGSHSNEYTIINYGDTGAPIGSPGDNLYDNPLNPIEFPSFPFGAEVPGKHQITIHGILGSEVATINATPALAIYTKYLKLLRDREVLFDEDRNGILFDASNATGAAGQKFASGWSLIGNQSHLDPRPPLIFAEPLVFEAGDELNILVTTVEPIDGSTISTLYQVIGLIQTVRRITG